MAKQTIWQKLNHKLNTKTKIFRNTATLIFNIREVSVDTGEDTSMRIESDFICPQPELVKNESGNGLYFAGDAIVSIDFITLKKIRENLEMNLGERGDLFSEMRPWRNSTGGIEQGADEVKFAGNVYSIRSVFAEDFMGNEPGIFRIVLKGVGENEV